MVITTSDNLNLIEVESRTTWREWLSANHDKVTEVWLVYFKEGAGKRGVDYESSVEEALCFGWVDSIIKKLDDTRYARKFTPRNNNSKWSVSNKKRVTSLIEAGLMAPSGLEKVDAAKKSGAWDNPVSKPVFDLSMPPEFEKALKENPAAMEQFEKMPSTHRKEYLLWIVTAKRPETRERRITEAVQMLSDGKKLGLR